MAVLEADVVGYSRLVAHDEVAISRLLAESRRRFEEGARKHRGQLAVQVGDAFLLTFPSALDAVQAALTIHRRHRNRPLTMRGGLRIHYRMGIDLGDVWEDEHGHLTGNAINIAARLEALADAGGLCVSEVVYQQVKSRGGLIFEDAGFQRLKNLPAPVRVFKGLVYTVVPSHTEVTDQAKRQLASPKSPTKIIPQIGKLRREEDWNTFVRDTYELIQQRFQIHLGSLKSQGRDVEVDFRQVHERMFRCHVFVGGKEEAQAKIWLGRMRGDIEHICYANHDALLEGEHTWNIALNPAPNREAPALWATGSPLGAHSSDYDLEGLSPEDATEYLWRHFIHPLTEGAAAE